MIDLHEACLLCAAGYQEVAIERRIREIGLDYLDIFDIVENEQTTLMAANAMKAGMAILRPLLIETGAPQVGKMVIGTVKGDIHDIGKNLVSMMMEGDKVSDVDIAGGDQQEPEGRQQQQGLRPLWPRRPSKT